jgi:hypothetical protein
MKMAKNQNKRLSPAIMQADLDALAAVQAIGSYAPANSAYAQVKVTEQLAALRAAQEAERAAQAALDSARDDAAAAEWDFHNFALAVKDQVIAQYGKNSNEVQSLGLKKKSEYKAPGRKKETA